MSRRQRRWVRANAVAIAATALIALLVLLGWSFEIDGLKRLSHTPTSMNPLTALSFLMAASGLWIMRTEPPQGARKRLVQGLSLVILLVGASKLIDLLLGTSFCPDELLFGAQVEAQKPYPSRMAPNTAMGFALLGASMLLMDAPRRGWLWAHWLSMPIRMLSVLAILGYLYDTSGFYTVKSYIPMAFYTAVGFLLSTTALLLSRPQHGLMPLLTAESGAGRMVRTLLPACILIPATLGWLAVWGQRQDYYSLTTGISLLVMVIMLLLSALVIWVGTRLSRVEQEMLEQNQALAEATVRARTAAALAEKSEQRYRAITEVNPQQLWTANTEGMLDYVNSEMTRYFGRSPERILGDQWRELMHPDDVAFVGPQWAHCLATGEPLAVEARLQRYDGEWRSYLIRAVPLRKDEVTSKWFGISVDVEELHRARASAEQASRMKSAFLSSMSHEIRTPMNAVIGFSGLLSDTPLNQQQQQFVDAIRSSGDHLLALINNILDFSKMEAGQLQLDKRAFGLRHLIEGALDLVAPTASDKGLELAYLLAEDIPTGLVADEGRLRQVLANLLANAVKFSHKGEVVVEVDATPMPGQPEWYEFHFSVRDEGIGLAPDHLPRLFQEFSQADISTARRYGGTGLGLAICKRLVEMHGGSIRAENRPEAGSIFRFSVPALAHAEPVPPPSASLRGLHLLAVDDNAVNLEILRRQAQSWGMQVTTLQEPEQAWVLAQRGERFNIAVLDHMMPGMDGPSLAQRLRTLPAYHRTPLVLLSSLGVPAPVELFALSLTKPIKQSALHDALVAALSVAPGHGRPQAALLQPLVLPKAAVASPLAILLAEDNVMNQKLALLLLQKLGYSADVAGNGLEALHALSQRHYDLVLMDVEMPDMDGLTAATEINHLYGANRPRIVALTAQALAGDRERCLAAGMDDYLSKPLRPEALAAVLGRVPQPAALERAAASSQDFSAKGLAQLIENYEVAGATAIVEALVRQLPRDKAELADALGSANIDILRRLAHTLKSCARTVGANDLGDLCEGIEQHAIEGQFDAAAVNAPAMLSRLEALLPQLQAGVRRAAQVASSQPSPLAAAAQQAAVPCRVLVVDDTAAHRIIIRQLLTTSLQVEVVEAEDGAQALRACQSQEFALILLDVVMPGMDGFELASRIAALNPAEATPLIFITGALRDDLSRIRAYGSGAADYIAKPFNEVELVSKVKVFVDLYRSRQRLRHEAQALAQQGQVAPSLHDPLTGLPNHLLFRDRLSHAADVAQRRSTSFALLHIQLDGFKPATELHGRVAGDQLLQQVGVRLRESGRKVDTPARLGGEGFGLIVDEPMTLEASLRFAERLRQRLTQPCELNLSAGLLQLELAVSIGVAIFPEHGHTLEGLMQAADSALDKARRAGRNQIAMAG